MSEQVAPGLIASGVDPVVHQLGPEHVDEALHGFCQHWRHCFLANEGWGGYRAAPHGRSRPGMQCVECGSEAVMERPERTAQG